MKSEQSNGILREKTRGVKRKEGIYETGQSVSIFSCVGASGDGADRPRAVTADGQMDAGRALSASRSDIRGYRYYWDR